METMLKIGKGAKRSDNGWEHGAVELNRASSDVVDQSKGPETTQLIAWTEPTLRNGTHPGQQHLLRKS